MSGVAAADTDVGTGHNEAEILPGEPASDAETAPGAEPGGPPTCEESRPPRGGLFGSPGQRGLHGDMGIDPQAGGHQPGHRVQCVDEPPPTNPGEPPETHRLESEDEGRTGAHDYERSANGEAHAEVPGSSRSGEGRDGRDDGERSGDAGGSGEPGSTSGTGPNGGPGAHGPGGAGVDGGPGTSAAQPGGSGQPHASDDDTTQDLGVATPAGGDVEGSGSLGGALAVLGGGGLVAAAATTWLAVRMRRN
ncbi:hypothetical protein [Saccharomonospora sp. CUA-673]|uniref:hypothetical protein n=1 Tax=Saccharomonospora sp. CUA-673 TaxID=1904969 RepID=UPI001115273A|nr:hypothetical protein [Saccharomonospora sp. CUA-673]